MDTCITETDIIDEKVTQAERQRHEVQSLAGPKGRSRSCGTEGPQNFYTGIKPSKNIWRLELSLSWQWMLQCSQSKKCNKCKNTMHNYQMTEPAHVPRRSCWSQFSLSFSHFPIVNCNVLTAHSFLAAHFKSTSFTGNGGIPVLSCLGLGNCKTGRSKFARAWGSTKERGWYKAQKRLSSKWRASLELWTWRKMSERKNWRFYQLNGQTCVIASFAIDWTFYQPWLSPEHIILQQIWPRR